MFRVKPKDLIDSNPLRISSAIEMQDIGRPDSPDSEKYSTKVETPQKDSEKNSNKNNFYNE